MYFISVLNNNFMLKMYKKKQYKFIQNKNNITIYNTVYKLVKSLRIRQNVLFKASETK